MAEFEGLKPGGVSKRRNCFIMVASGTAGAENRRARLSVEILKLGKSIEFLI